LSKAISWSQNPRDDFPAESDGERSAILEAARVLAPKRGGDAEYVEISGRVVGTGSVTLRNSVRLLAAQQLREIRRDEPEMITVQVEGRIGDVDVDRRQGILREFHVTIPESYQHINPLLGNEVRFSFDAERVEDCLEAMTDRARVLLLAETEPNSEIVRMILIRRPREIAEPTGE
jgi:hypothetical protein